jgi:acetyltransferase-like isoleucine patch superfamily enzyme
MKRNRILISRASIVNALVRIIAAKSIRNKIFDGIHTIQYRRKFASLKGLHIVGRAGLKIIGSGKIYAGNLHVLALYFPTVIYVGPRAKLKIGDDVFLNQGVGISCASQVTIEDETMISEMTIITDTDWHGIDGKKPEVEPVFIGKHVWIGFKCAILKGVTIGDNSIIGAGSVVTHSVRSNTIVAGNPAKQIGITKSGYTK